MEPVYIFKEMTIRDSDLDDYESTIDHFFPQHEFRDCLPAALKSVIDELNHRKDDFSFELSLSDSHNICEFDGLLGSTSKYIRPRLNEALNAYEVKEEVLLSYDDLREIIDRNETSYPIVDLNSDYFSTVEHSRFLEGEPGNTEINIEDMTHTIIPVKANSSEILYWDPLSPMYLRSSRVDEPPRTRSQEDFHEWWSDTPDIRWALWIERKIQQVLD